jgi:hypothetical protein
MTGNMRARRRLRCSALSATLRSVIAPKLQK